MTCCVLAVLFLFFSSFFFSLFVELSRKVKTPPSHEMNERLASPAPLPPSLPPSPPSTFGGQVDKPLLQVKGDTEAHPFRIKAAFGFLDGSKKTFHETSLVDLDLNSPEINQLLQPTNFKHENEPVAEHASRPVFQNRTPSASPFAQSLDQAERGTEMLSAPMAVQRLASVRHTNPLQKPGAR